MTDIVEFLRARLDEAERLARAAAEESDAEWYTGDGVVSNAVGWDMRLFVAANDPAYVLADVEAKRRIVEEHVCPCPDDCGDCGACSGDHHADPTPAPCTTLRLLALPYAGHPEWQEEWGLDG